jgi:hypothetical protein
MTRRRDDVGVSLASVLLETKLNCMFIRNISVWVCCFTVRLNLDQKSGV